MDKLITDNYDYLLNISKSITKRYKSREPDMCYNLLHTCISMVYNNIDNSNQFLSDTDSFRKYLTKYIKNTFEWNKQKCYDRQKDNDIFTFHSIENDNEASSGIDNSESFKNQKNELAGDINTEQLIMLHAENVDDITKLYLTDLLVNDIPISRGLDYQKILDLAKSLDPLTYQLFYLVYMEGMKVKAIQRELNKKLKDQPIGYTDLLLMVKEMKIKINNRMQCLK